MAQRRRLPIHAWSSAGGIAVLFGAKEAATNPRLELGRRDSSKGLIREQQGRGCRGEEEEEEEENEEEEKEERTSLKKSSNPNTGGWGKTKSNDETIKRELE